MKRKQMVLGRVYFRRWLEKNYDREVSELINNDIDKAIMELDRVLK